MKLIKFLSIFIIILMMTGCSGCISIPGILKHKTDSLNVELHIAKPTATIIPLFGKVSEEWAIDVEKALQNSRCSLVVLWIESPGGSVTETILLTHKLKVFQKKYNKQIYVYSERILASGAYWVASAFEKIIISPAGRTGSIGVYMVRADYSDLYDKLGLKYHYIASDSTKVMGNDATPMEKWERDYWQWSINTIHASFMEHIWNYRSTQLIASYKHRNLKSVKTAQDTLLVANQFRLIANGMLYGSALALHAGLIDGVMYFDEFVKVLQSNGFVIVTLEGEIITEFYPFSSEKDSTKEEMAQEIWDHLQVEKGR